jgi:1-acyl-sn-glycerol-3-phosphate acyltransferase
VTDHLPRYPHVNVTLYRVARVLFRFLAALLIKKMDVQGTENLLQEGAFVLVLNHLSFLDSPLLFITVPRVIYMLAGERYQHHIFSLLLRIGGAIFVQRGEVDRNALRQALNVLEDGHCLALAIEGTRSKTGQMIPGKTGAAYVATRSSAPIVPVAVWGTEQIFPTWKRFRRPDEVHIHFGKMFHLPEGHARSAELDAYTDDIMTTLASMLPEDYRGVYKDHPLLAQKLSSKK